MTSSTPSPVPVHVDFHYDISCPFAYIASLLLPQYLSPTSHPGLTITYRPVLLGALYRATSAPQGAAGSASDTFNATKKAVTGAGFARTVRRLGVRLRQPGGHPMKTTRALRLLYAVRDGDGDGDEGRREVTRELFEAYWVRGEDVSELGVLVGVVGRCAGLGEAVRRELVRGLEGGVFDRDGSGERRLLEEATEVALRRGAFGVPAFWVYGEERLYWGQDRLGLVRRAVLRLEGREGEEKLEALVPRVVPAAERRVPDGEEVKLEFWYDFSSPWAFLGWTQLARLQRVFGERLKIEMKPFLLGILFREIGAPNLPMAAISEAKRRYSGLDHADWCRWWNDVNKQNGSPDKHIDFYWADVFPIRTPTVLRAALAEPKLVDILFRACWESNKDVSSDSVLYAVIAEAGYDADAVMAKANSQEIKQSLRAMTKEAKDTGICGVPSYRIFRRKIGQSEQDWKLASDIVWGQDETAVVEDYISGWDGQRSVQGAGRGGDGQSGVSKL